MIGSDADASTDLTGAPDSCGSSKGHRQNDDTWDLSEEKKKLSPEEAIKQHRNYCAVCKACGTEMHGTPEVMKQHIVDCKKADHADQLQTLHKQADSLASESGSQPQNDTPMNRYVDRVRVTPQQKAKWQYLLAIAATLPTLQQTMLRRPALLQTQLGMLQQPTQLIPWNCAPLQSW
ncbi:TPA: hypothetical protein ACH3X1_006671 [Trebouxia sp. C0004]